MKHRFVFDLRISHGLGVKYEIKPNNQYEEKDIEQLIKDIQDLIEGTLEHLRCKNKIKEKFGKED